MNSFFREFGYNSGKDFYDSAFHLDSLKATSFISVSLGFIGTTIESILGFHPVIFIVMFLLFLMEVFTGIKASKKEGKAITSKKFGSGLLKLGIYLIFIGLTNLLAKNMDIKTVMGFNLNYYEWIHYAVLNFVIIQYLISNIENFNRLGWDEFLPILKKLQNILEFKKINKD